MSLRTCQISIFFLVFFSFCIISCSDKADDEGSPIDPDDDASSDDDDVSPPDDDNDDNDSSDDDNDTTLDEFCVDGFDTPYGGCIRQIPESGHPGSNGLGMRSGPDGTLYVIAAKGREIVLYDRVPGDDFWSSYVIARMGTDPDLAIDSNGALHVAYTDLWYETVNYATNASGEWEIDVVDDVGFLNEYGSLDPGAFAAIALDADENPHLSYRNFDNNSLRYARRTQDGWSIEEFTTDNYYGYGYATDIEIDQGGFAHIVHTSLMGELSTTVYFTSNKSGVWRTETIRVGGSSPYLALDREGLDHLTYVYTVAGGVLYLRYATNKSGAWRSYFPDFTQDHARLAPLSFDSYGNVHITYYLGTVSDHLLRHVFGSPDAWQIEDLAEETSLNSGIAQVITPDDNIHVAYFNARDEVLYHMANDTELWEREIIDHSNAECGAMDLDTDGTLYFLCQSHYRILLYSFSGAIWTKEFELTTEAKTAIISDLIVDDSGVIHFAFTDESALNYCTFDSESVDCETPFPEMSFRHVSFLVGNDANINITANIYLEGLWFAAKNNGSWTIELIDADGYDSTVKPDRMGNYHIAYTAAGRTLKYATFVSDRWEVYMIDEEADISGFPSMTLSDGEDVIIAYSSGGNLSDLRYAVKIDNDKWDIRSINSSVANSFYNPSVISTSEGKLLFVYGSGGRKLAFSIRYGDDWLDGLLDSAGYVSVRGERSLVLRDSLYIGYGAEFGESFAVIPITND